MKHDFDESLRLNEKFTIWKIIQKLLRHRRCEIQVVENAFEFSIIDYGSMAGCWLLILNALQDRFYYLFNLQWLFRTFFVFNCIL